MSASVGRGSRSKPKRQAKPLTQKMLDRIFKRLQKGAVPTMRDKKGRPVYVLWLVQ